MNRTYDESIATSLTQLYFYETLNFMFSKRFPFLLVFILQSGKKKVENEVNTPFSHLSTILTRFSPFSISHSHCHLENIRAKLSSFHFWLSPSLFFSLSSQAAHIYIDTFSLGMRVKSSYFRNVPPRCLKTFLASPVPSTARTKKMNHFQLA